MQKIIQNIILGPITLFVSFTLLFATAYFLGNAYSWSKENYALFFDILSYTSFVVCFIFLWYYRGDYLKTKMQSSYFMFLFLSVFAALREMGIQHWLASTDTTAFKSRFFLNPNNLISEKIVSGIILLSVAVVIGYLLYKYVPKIIRGVFQLSPLYWTIATLGGIGVIAKFIDRFPSNYRKSTGIFLPEEVRHLFMLVEESCEIVLPILVVLALAQYHIQISKKS